MDKSKKFIIIKELKTGLPWIESILWFAIIRWPKKFSLKIQTVKDSQRCLESRKKTWQFLGQNYLITTSLLQTWSETKERKENELKIKIIKRRRKGTKNDEVQIF